MYIQYPTSFVTLSIQFVELLFKLFVCLKPFAGLKFVLCCFTSYYSAPGMEHSIVMNMSVWYSPFFLLLPMWYIMYFGFMDDVIFAHNGPYVTGLCTQLCSPQGSCLPPRQFFCLFLPWQPTTRSWTKWLAWPHYFWLGLDVSASVLPLHWPSWLGSQTLIR